MLELTLEDTQLADAFLPLPETNSNPSPHETCLCNFRRFVVMPGCLDGVALLHVHAVLDRLVGLEVHAHGDLRGHVGFLAAAVWTDTLAR